MSMINALKRLRRVDAKLLRASQFVALLFFPFSSYSRPSWIKCQTFQWYSIVNLLFFFFLSCPRAESFLALRFRFKANWIIYIRKKSRRRRTSIELFFFIKEKKEQPYGKRQKQHSERVVDRL